MKSKFKLYGRPVDITDSCVEHGQFQAYEAYYMDTGNDLTLEELLIISAVYADNLQSIYDSETNGNY